MNFEQAFSVSSPQVGPSAVAGIEPSCNVKPGLYDAGLVAVLDDVLAGEIAKEWNWLLGKDAIPLATTAFGDVFFWSERYSAVYFLEVQRGACTFVDKSLEYFMNDFLTVEGVKEQVLSRHRFQEVTVRIGCIQYGQCLIAVPWERLGGNGAASSYEKGDLMVYHALVAQAVRQELEESKTSGSAAF